MSAARREFAAKGIAGARVDAIAKRAGVNKRMLYHYFGSKDGLFQAVLMRTLAERLAHVVGDSPDAASRMRGRARFYASSSEYVRLLMWEALERPSTEPSERPERAAAYDRLLRQVQTDQGRGLIPAEFDARQWALAELALGLMPVAFPQLTKLTVGIAADSDEFKEAHQTFLGQLAERLQQGAGSAEGEDPPTA